MKTMIKNKILIVIASVLVLSLSVGFASAYFSDHEAAQGAATIQLGGQTEIEEGWKDGIKHVSIKNIGETEVIVRVAIYGPNSEDAKLSVTATGNWVDGGDGYYYYKEILQPGDPGDATPLDDLTAKVVFKEGADLGDNFDIVVMQESAQPTYEYVEVGGTFKNKVVPPAGWDGMPTIYASEEGGE